LRNLVFAFAALVFCAAVATRAQETVARKTVREAVYTEAQAERGKKVYEANCVTCHLPDLDGSANPDAGARGAPLVGTRFVQDFGESKVSALFNKMKRDMPSGRPGTLTDQEYLDATAFVLQRNNFPAGATELTEDRATEFWIPGAGGAEGLQNYTFVTTVGCLHQDPTRSWFVTNAQALKETDPKAGTAPAVADNPGEFTFRLLDAISYDPDPHNGHKVRVSGYMVRLGAEIRVNVQALQMIGASCGK
jgi:mono/diheme cytochrome c family protein